MDALLDYMAAHAFCLLYYVVQLQNDIKYYNIIQKKLVFLVGLFIIKR